ncbi:MAG: Mov34/MPN/PAD-1 family protein [Nitrospinota bacterium]
MMFKINQEIVNQIFKHGESDAPLEACGYLAGKDGIVTRCYPMDNKDRSEEHFTLDPEEQFKVIREANSLGLNILAVYHTHPATPARPSNEDIRLAYDPNIVYVIASLSDKEIKAFKIKKGEVLNLKIEIEGLKICGLELDLAAMKKFGMIQQKQKGFFAMRLHTVGGDLTVAQLQRIADIAKKYGEGFVHLSTRQGVEIHGVHNKYLEIARKELAEVGIKMGACGPRVRIVVACPGEATCRWGIIDTKEMAKELDSRYFREDTPHKFKLSVTGCPHNCAKATENDIGIMGGMLPRWEEDKCINCDLCLNVCPTEAITKEDNQYKLNEEKCIYCSICTSSCPTSAWVGAKTGYTVFIGGTMGKIPRLATRLKALAEKEESYRLVERALRYYQENGRKKERFGHMIDRIGVDKVKEEILNGP